MPRLRRSADDGGTPQAPNISIADLHDLCGKGPLNIDEPLVAGGYVTSSDRAGNFNRTFTIEDPTGGMEIMAGLYDLHNIYPSGCYVTVRLEGCAVAESHGCYRRGYPPRSTTATLPLISRRERFSTATCVVTTSVARWRPRLCQPPNSTRGCAASSSHRSAASDHDRTCGRLERKRRRHMERIQFLRRRSRHDRRRIYIGLCRLCGPPRTRPQGRLDGILQYGTADGEDCFMIKMRDENDCIPYD